MERKKTARIISLMSCAEDMRTGSLPVYAALRERIQRLEGAAARHRTVLAFGIKPIDQHLPEGGLALGALHEVAGRGPWRDRRR